MKTVTFAIEPFTTSLNRFKETFKAAQAGQPAEPREVAGFTSVSGGGSQLPDAGTPSLASYDQAPPAGLDL
jgi:hypothetical protein